MTTGSDPGFLAGLRVVETGEGVAGAVAASCLASLGATVARIGSPAPLPDGHTPEELRSWMLGRSKVHTPVGSAEADRLLDGAAIVIDDRSGGVGDPAAHIARVRSRNRATWVTISPFGLSGPRSGQRGGELVALASSGLLRTTEPPGGGAPGNPPAALAGRIVGQVAALAALHGHDHHIEVGAPVHVEVSAQEAVTYIGSLPECAHVLFDCPGRAGSGRYLAPSGTFPCADGLVRITAIENHQWKGLVDCLGGPSWTEGLEDRPARIDHAELIRREVASWTATLDKAACADLLQDHRVPATPVNDPTDLLRSPQYAARGFLQRVGVAGGEATLPGSPWIHRHHPGGRPRGPSGRIAGLPVVELTHVLAGPIVGSLLGAMGADVVRLEDLGRLDIYRRSGPFAGGVSGLERGAYFAVANHSKGSIAAEGEEVTTTLADLMRRSAVLIENVGATRLERLGVDTAATATEGVLAVSVSGFGSTGPLSHYRVYAGNVHAYGGLASLTVDDDGGPTHLGTVLADPLAALTAATVVAAWALSPSRSGGVIDLSMAEVVTTTVGEYLAAASLGASTEELRHRTRRPPAGVHRCGDGALVVLAIDSDDDERAASTHFGSPSQLAQTLGELRATEAVSRLHAAGLAAAVVQDAADLVTDEHLAARGFFPQVDHPDPELGTARIVGLPWRFAGEGPVRLAPPPALGSSDALHSSEVP